MLKAVTTVMLVNHLIYNELQKKLGLNLRNSAFYGLKRLVSRAKIGRFAARNATY